MQNKITKKKNILNALLLMGALALGSSFSGCESKETPKTIKEENIAKASINIDGMTCDPCKVTIERVNKNVEGIVSIEVSLEDKKAEVAYDKTQTNLKEIMKAIELKGYRPLSYEDESGLHENKDLKPMEPAASESEGKCGATGKCGGGKCGSGKCGGAD